MGDTPRALAVPVMNRLGLGLAITVLFVVAGGWWGLLASVPLWLLVLAGILLDHV